MKFCPKCERPFQPEEILASGDLELIYGIGIRFKNQELLIPKGQQQLLRLLMRRRFISYERMIEEICREETRDARGSLKVQIHNLRKSLRLLNAPYEIMSRSGMGYSLVHFPSPQTQERSAA
jgi:DNA-binding response OmpR family regulator